MAYGKLKKFCKENSWCRDYVKEGMLFEAWITYIRENDKDPVLIFQDIDQEINTKRCTLNENEKISLQREAMHYLALRRGI